MKLINDTMKSNGKWSAKRVTAFCSFSMACALPLYSLYKGTLNHEILVLAGEFLTAALVCLGVSSWQKTQLAKSAPEQVITDENA